MNENTDSSRLEGHPGLAGQSGCLETLEIVEHSGCADDSALGGRAANPDPSGLAGHSNPAAPSEPVVHPPHEAKHDAALAVELAYNGAAYSGFARQKDDAVPTVQEKLEEALSVLLRREVPTVCAGRTDAGVHARAQVISCGVDLAEIRGREKRSLVTSLNALTPSDISIRSVNLRSVDFSARFDAVRREYRYRIVTGPTPPVFLDAFAWWLRNPLDLDAMSQAGAHLVGEHDFKSFCKAASAQDKTTMRFVERVDVFTEEQLGEECICIRVVGNAFLHSMVRTIVGTLVRVGSGRKPPEWMASVLQARDRAAAGETAPAKGLVFWQVDYPEPAQFLPWPQ